jgi:hypothetical protein
MMEITKLSDSISQQISFLIHFDPPPTAGASVFARGRNKTLQSIFYLVNALKSSLHFVSVNARPILSDVRNLLYIRIIIT